jgi:hypothetical protein
MDTVPWLTWCSCADHYMPLDQTPCKTESCTDGYADQRCTY